MSVILNISAIGPGGTELIPTQAEIAVGPGDLYLALALIYTLGFLYLLNPADVDRRLKTQLQLMIRSVVIPLLFGFAGVVVYTTLTLV